MRSARPGHPRRTFSRSPSSRAAAFRTEPLEPRRLLSVAISEPYEYAASGSRAGFFADFTSDERPTEVVASWGDGAVEGLVASEPVGPGAVDLDMIDYDPATRRGTVYGLHDYPEAGHYAVTFTVRGGGGTFDSATFFADVSAPAPAAAENQEPASAVAGDDGLAAGAAVDALASEPAEAYASGVQVTQVFVNGPTVTCGSLAFKVAAGVDATFGYAVPGGTVQTTPLSWVGGINSVSIRFNQQVAALLDQGDLAVTGEGGEFRTIATTGFTYDAATYTGTWTFAAVIRDKLRFVVDDARVPTLDGEWRNPTEVLPTVGGDSYPSGDGSAGGDFNFRVNVLHGDVSGDGVVNAIDVAEIKRRLTRRPNDGVMDPLRMYTIFSDITGDGVINANDLAQVKARLTHRMDGSTGSTGGGAATVVDLAVDSDNTNGKNLPDLSTYEEAIEDDSELPGKLIVANNDDDNNNDVPDNEEIGVIAGENDLIPMLIAVDSSDAGGCSCGCGTSGGGTSGGTVTLSVTSGSDLVRVWKNSQRDSDGPLLAEGLPPKSWPAGQQPDIVWVEAVGGSVADGDIRFTLAAGGDQDSSRLMAANVKAVYGRIGNDQVGSPHGTATFPGNAQRAAVVLRGSGPMALQGVIENEPAPFVKDNLRWAVQRNANDSNNLKAGALPTVTPDPADPLKATLTTNAVGSFLAILYNELDGVAGFSAAANGDALLKALPLIQVGLAVKSSTVNANPAFSSAPFPQQGDMRPLTSVRSGDGQNGKAMSVTAEVELTGGGADEKLGLDRVKLGWISNMTATRVDANYDNLKRVRLALKAGLQAPLLDSGRPDAGTGADTAFRATSAEAAGPQLATKELRTVTEHDSPATEHFDIYQPDRTKANSLAAPTTAAGRYAFKEFLSAYSTMYWKTHVTAGQFDWSIDWSLQFVNDEWRAAPATQVVIPETKKIDTAQPVQLVTALGGKTTGPSAAEPTNWAWYFLDEPPA